MVLRYHGRTISEAAVRQLLGTTSLGTRAAAVLHVSSWGFDEQFGASNLPQWHGRALPARGFQVLGMNRTQSRRARRSTRGAQIRLARAAAIP
jgi:hypothetical protein